MLKTLLRISTAYLLIVSIVLGYTGITVFKMVCGKEGGKTIVSVTTLQGSCAHEAQSTPHCCKPVKTTLPAGCCDYSNTYIKLKDKGHTVQPQTGTGHMLPVTVHPVRDLNPPLLCGIIHTAHSFELYPPGQSRQSLTQVFRI